MLTPEVLTDTTAVDRFRSAEPFPHIVFDNAFDPDALSASVYYWPTCREECWKRYQRGKRNAMNPADLWPALAIVMRYGTDPAFVAWLQWLTGVPGLLPDPQFRGGGLHEVESGGSLPMHVDFNRLDDAYRRVNVMLYVNDDWDTTWGGALELRKDPKSKDGAIKIDPIWNRLVVFESSERSWHGHTEPLACPDYRFRRSLAWYFYTLEPPPDYSEKHSTIYVRS